MFTTSSNRISCVQFGYLTFNIEYDRKTFALRRCPLH
ncbi:hypothetical protein EG68_07552 [Paragonimus skrjabini miyazakii]|uniref:Uncharacterized protein n=1 Tax=Paragonimus skrjabini miyazakii TaxID=59628 RepID=A0A8S9YLF0_9TREM|nr:hypothetical protein EG68_07552 [Paragonimus skrjabini miyazakii]